MKRLFAALLSTLVLSPSAFAADALDFGWAVGTDNSSNSLTNFTLDEATDQIEYIFQCEEAVAITKLAFLVGTRTGSNATVTYEVSLQGVNTSGRADGTIKGAGNNAKATYDPADSAADDGTWQSKTLTASHTCTRGEFLAEVIKPLTFVAANSVSFTTHSVGMDDGFAFPGAVTFNATGSVVTRVAAAPIFGYESATQVYGRPLKSISASNTQFSSDSSPDEYGLVFTIPAGWCDTVSLKGLTWTGRTPAAAKSILVNLYDTTSSSDTTDRAEIATATIDSDAMQATASVKKSKLLFTNVTLPTLTCGNTYRLTLAPQETGANISVTNFTVNANADLAAWPGGIGFYETSRTDVTGTWTNTNTIRPLISPILEDMTEPVAVGSTTGRGPQISGPYTFTLTEATAAERRVYFNLVDATDGNAAETGVTVSNTNECQISENGGAFANCTGTTTEVGSGLYYHELAAADVDTVGCHLLKIADAAAQTTITSYCVRAFDATSTAPNVNVASATSGAIEEQDFLGTGQFQAGGSGTSWILSASETASDIGGQTICDVSTKQCRRCNTYNTGTKTCTVDSGITPTNGNYYTIGNRYGEIGTGVTPAVDVSKWNGTNVATPNTAGYPIVQIDSGTGTGQLSLSSGLVSVSTVSTGAIAAASFAAGAIDATAIAADAIGASELATDAIGAAEIAADAVGASEIATDAIGAAELASAAIAADEIATDAIGAAEIAADSIGASELATDAIGAAELAANAIAAAEVADGAIDALTFAAGAIDAAAIATDAITATEIAANAISDAEVGATLTVDINGSVSGSVGSVTGAVGSIGTGGIDTASFAAGAINAAAIAADAIGASELATDSIGAAEIAANAINDSELADTLTVAITGNVTGNVSGSVGSVATGGIAAASFAAGAIDAPAIAADAIGASELAASAIGTSEFAAEADVNGEVVDALNVDTYAELAACPTDGAKSLVAKIGYIYMAARNKLTQDATTTTLFKDDGSTSFCASTTGVTAGTFSRTEMQ